MLDEDVKSYTLEANELAWITDRTPHESLPVNGERQYFRLVVGKIGAWYAHHSTANPIVPVPDDVTIVQGDKFASAPAPSLDAPAPAMKGKDAKRAAKKAAKLEKKAAASAAPRQKPKRRKAKTGEKKVDLPPTEAELRASAKYDAMVEEGGLVYECFIRAKGPNQWFPLGPMAVKQDWMIVPEMWKAEADMKKAGVKMYPALLNAPCFGKVEYGYRVPADAAEVTEDQIREAKRNLTPGEAE